MIRSILLQRNNEVSYIKRPLERPIIKALQSLGGSASKQAVKEEIVASDPDTYREAFEPRLSKNGRQYLPFNISFNFALTNLRTCGYIEDYVRREDIVLTEKGRIATFNTFPSNEEKEIIRLYWDKKHQEHSERERNSPKTINEDKPDASEDSIEISVEETDSSSEDWKITVLAQIKLFSPRKFENFSRALLSKMGVKFDNIIGIRMTGDHGIDGFGYIESNELRTSKVVIQCKRYTDTPVSEPDIDKFKGAMSSHDADYGIFITTSSFTKQAQEKAVQGRNLITLIDGQRLCELIEKYQLYIEPVQTYALKDYYYQED